VNLKKTLKQDSPQIRLNVDKLNDLYIEVFKAKVGADVVPSTC